ncbi:hypothetical protein [Mycoplasma sp. P36-A1]|uniref:hypothetical protein n=1 Tax=Mycoplasma sp. P36-A1 TaxID=3252900 RepID=UPI003C2CAF19
MRYYNSTQKKYMSIIGDEPTITDENTDTRKIKINCIKFFVANTNNKNKGESFILRQTDSSTKVLNDWYTCKLGKKVMGYTTFDSIAPKRTTSVNVTPLIISGSYDYDGEKESFDIPLLAPIYANDNIKCSISNKSSTKNSLSINPESGIISVSKEV